MPAPSSLARHGDSTHGGASIKAFREARKHVTESSEYLCFSIWQKEVCATFVFRGTSAVHYELHLNLHFLRIVFTFDTLQTKNKKSARGEKNKKTIRGEIKARLSNKKTYHAHFDQAGRICLQVERLAFSSSRSKMSQISKSLADTKSTEVRGDETQTSSSPVVPEKPSVRD